MTKILDKGFDSIGNGNAWVFCTDRALDDDSLKVLKTALIQFMNQWEAHGQPVHGSFQIYRSQLIIIASDSDKQKTTGCSIDSMVQVMRSMGERLNIDFFDRFNIPIVKDGALTIYRPEQIEGAVNDGHIARNDLMVNLAISDIRELKDRLLITLEDSWVARHVEF